MPDIWRGEKHRYELAGQVGDDGRVWVGELRKYDLAGEVDGEGNIWRGEKRRCELAGQVVADGRVWVGELRKYDLAGEVDGEGNIWRGEKRRCELAGQVDPPSRRAGAAGLLLLLGDTRSGLRGDASNVVRQAAVATTVGLAVDVAARLLDPARRRGRRLQRLVRDLVAKEGSEIQRAERLLAAGDASSAEDAALAVGAGLDDRIESETDGEVLLRLRVMRAWAHSVAVRASPDGRRSEGDILLIELSEIRESTPAGEIGLAQEVTKLRFFVASALRLPKEAAAAAEELCRLAPGESPHEEWLHAAREWAALARQEEVAEAATRALDDLTEASRHLIELGQLHVEESSALQQLADGESKAEGLRWAERALVTQQEQSRRLASGVERQASAVDVVQKLRPRTSGTLTELIDEALASGERTLRLNEDDLRRREPVIEDLRRIVEQSGESAPSAVVLDVQQLKRRAEDSQRVIADVQAHLQRSAEVLSGNATRADAAAAHAVLTEQFESLVELESVLRADFSAWDSLSLGDSTEPTRALLERQLETLLALKAGLERIIDRVGQALADPGGSS